MIDKSLFISGIVDKYPEELLEGRAPAEGNLVALLFKNPDLYSDIGKDIDEQSMITKDGRFLFSLGKSLKDQGFTVFDEVTIYSNLKEDLRDRFDGFGGWKSLENLMSVVDEKNTEAIIDNLNKSNVLIKLYNKGFNVCNEVTTDKGKKVIPIKLFKPYSTQTVLDWYEEAIASCGTDVRSDLITGSSYIDFDDAFIENLEKGVERGVSISKSGTDIDGEDVNAFRFLDSDICGFKPGTLNAIGGASGMGKSSLMLNMVMSLASQGIKTVIINNEMMISDYQCMILVWILSQVFKYYKLTKRKLMSGNLNDEDKEMIAKARKYYKETYGDKIKIVTLADANMDLSLQIAKKEIKRYGAGCIVIDTFKITMGEGGGDAYWMQLVKDSRSYEKLCKKENVIGLMTIQLSISMSNKLFLDASCLSNSKQIKEVLSTLLLVRKMQSYEREAGSPYYINPFRHVKNDAGVWEEQPYEFDDDSNYTVLFVDKNRRGQDSGSNGIAYLLKQKLDYCVFKESAKCRPTHKLADQV